MTLEEKIEIIKAFSEGKPVEGCNKEVGLWEDKVYDIWDFDDCKYRIKPETTTKFKAGDVLLAKEDEYQSNPARFEVSDIKQGCYCFKDYMDKPINDIDRDYINERDVLWFFEGKTIYGDKWSILCDFSRQRIPNMEELYKRQPDAIVWQPIYSMGFKLKED
ncbi:hypothetical protein [Campylobacter concisus]